MPKYAVYDPTGPEPWPVTGWYDLDLFKYSDLPSHKIELTAEQWRDRMAGHWAVQNNTLVSYTKPPPEHKPTAELKTTSPVDGQYQALEKRIADLEAKLSPQSKAKKP